LHRVGTDLASPPAASTPAGYMFCSVSYLFILVTTPVRPIISKYTRLSWWRGTVAERRSLAGELSLSCARPAADG